MSIYFINPNVTSKERYDLAKFMQFTDNFDSLTSSFFVSLSSLPQAGSYVIQSEEGRPDLLAWKIYKSTQYWWLILLYNQVFNIETEIVAGRTIKYPSLTDIENVYFSLKSQQAAANK